MAIRFSPSKPNSWSSNEIPETIEYVWLTDQFREANDAVKRGIQSPFQSIMFKTADLQAIASQDGCKYIAFSHLLIRDKSDGKVYYSTLLAFGLRASDGIIGDKSSQSFIGTPAQSMIEFGNASFGQAKIILNNLTKGYKWVLNEEGATKITDWLSKPAAERRFQKDIDFPIRVRINKSEADAFLKGYKEDSLIACYPVVHWCEIAETQRQNNERDGDFCTLAMYGLEPKAPLGLDKTHAFFISSDAWRPNWPKGASLQNMLANLVLR